MLLTGKSHSISIARRASRDVFLWVLCFLVANYVRFEEFFKLNNYLLSVGMGALGLVVTAYIFGMYSVESRGGSRFFAHGLLFTTAFLIALLVVTIVGYVDFGTRVGRGFMALAVSMAYPLLLLHHWAMFNKHRLAPERVAFVAESLNEMAEYQRIKELDPRGIEIVGRIDISGAPSQGDLLGRIKHVSRLISRHKIDRIVFPDARLDDEQARSYLRQLRYSGKTCTPLISLCEEYLQYVPLHLVTTEWLMHSESSPRELYFRKVKRTFDVLTSLALLVLLSPALLVGICIVKFFSPEGPLFFRQERVGRFGKHFQILKLRSMRTDAEKNGPQWSSVSGDSRVFPCGAFLRRYRIDEIPQLINILRGDMSFVGPRPEQPVFVETLAKVLPFYEERHMIHPGLTGWAQVSYPYGATTGDAHCKLEYDLYYLKHAGITFDLLILLDTVRVVLIGGMKRAAQRPRYPTTISGPLETAETKIVEEAIA
ncbi:MAG: exopolysaccharide biosynthesis polyprenyl glycosylphosphotransferase [Prosthecobacter sp.]|nr:exopolysaccharide biosynthesis polyprenyl glycosylphosphotransferase [Prosthecobacter sp.]